MSNYERARDALLCVYAGHMQDIQNLTRRIGYLVANVEDTIEDVSDFHAAVESLLGVAPVSGPGRSLYDLLGEADRRLLTELRRARESLVLDFFIRHPLAGSDSGAGGVALERARHNLDEVGQVLNRADALVVRLERERPDDI